MTNLIATVLVSWVTNTADVIPMKNVPAPCDHNSGGGGFAPAINWAYGCAVAHWKTIPDPDAREKTIITTCKRITVLKFDWHGPREIVSEEIIWQSNHLAKLEWVPK